MSAAVGGRLTPARPSRLLRALGWATFAAVFGVLGLAATATLKPGVLGIPYSHVIVSGESMLPTMSSGDLVIVQRRDRYEHGDVVAYRVPTEDGSRGALVIHRIVAGNAKAGYIFRGDNRPSRDPWQVKPREVLGESALRIPKLGHVFVFLRRPVGFAILAAALSLFFILRSPSEDAGQIAESR